MEMQEERLSHIRSAVAELRRAVKGESGATFDPFARIWMFWGGGVPSLPRIQRGYELLVGLGVTDAEMETWRQAYDKDGAGQRARAEAREGEQISEMVQRLIRGPTDHLVDPKLPRAELEKLMTPLKFVFWELVALLDASDGEFPARLQEFSVTEELWQGWIGLYGLEEFDSDEFVDDMSFVFGDPDTPH